MKQLTALDESNLDRLKYLAKARLADKKGAVNAGVGAMIAVLILILVMVNLAPEMFGGIADFNTTSEGGTTPDWVPTIINVIVAAGLVMMTWRSFK